MSGTQVSLARTSMKKRKSNVGEGREFSSDE